MADAKASPMKAKALILFLALVAMLPLAAQAQVNYAVSGNTAYVTYSSGAFGNVVIASTYNGYPVTSIGDDAFSDCSSLVGVAIGTNVTSIGTAAFYFCHNLAGIIIPNSVTNIGNGAFMACYDLTNITIPNNVTNIGVEAFDGCASLTNIAVTTDNPTYSSTNGVLFDKNQTTLVAFPGAYTSYTIPNSVSYIGDYAFAGCINLTNVVIGNNVEVIGNSAFNYCINLKNVVIPNGVLSIRQSAFNDCPSLTTVVIPYSVTSIGSFAFAWCINLTNITFLGNAPGLGGDVFYDDSATVYYYYGTSGWGTTYGGLPAVMLGAPTPQIGGGGSVGMQSGNFSFTIAGVANQTVVVEATTNLVDWQPVWTNTLSGASATFTDSQWTNYPARFYRAR